MQNGRVKVGKFSGKWMKSSRPAAEFSWREVDAVATLQMWDAKKRDRVPEEVVSTVKLEGEADAESHVQSKTAPVAAKKVVAKAVAKTKGGGEVPSELF